MTDEERKAQRREARDKVAAKLRKWADLLVSDEPLHTDEPYISARPITRDVTGPNDTAKQYECIGTVYTLTCVELK